MTEGYYSFRPNLFIFVKLLQSATQTDPSERELKDGKEQKLTAESAVPTKTAPLLYKGAV